MVGSHRVPHVVLGQGAPDRCRRWVLSLLVAAIGVVLLGLGGSRAQAAPTVVLSGVTVHEHGTAYGQLYRLRNGFSNAGSDGTDGTMFRIAFTITPAASSTITGCWLEISRNGGSYQRHPWARLLENPADADWRNGKPFVSGGSGGVAAAYNLDIPGWLLRGAYDDDADPVRNPDYNFWDNNPTSIRVRFYVTSSEATGNTAYSGVFPADSSAPLNGSFRVGASGREVLIPVDASGTPDISRPNKGGLIVSPIDGSNDDDGTSSSTYTFRVMYRHPEGLPPRVAYSQLHLSGGPSPSDPWRFPVNPDPTVPTTTDSNYYNSAVGLYLDTNALEDATDTLLDPVNATHALGAFCTSGYGSRTSSPDVHFMRPTVGTLTADLCRQGVIYEYTIKPTNHEVAVGMPANMFNGALFGTGGILTSLLNGFGSLLNFVGMNYVDGDYTFSQSANQRARPDRDGYDTDATAGTDDAPDRTSRAFTSPFQALSAGIHGFTYRCTSDITPASSASYGTYDSLTPFTLQEFYRFPDYYDCAWQGAGNQPGLVFPEVSDNAGISSTFAGGTAPNNYGWRWMQFRKPVVNPSLSTDVATAYPLVTNYPIRIATPVTVPTPRRAGQIGYDDEAISTTEPEVLLIDSTRALSAETLRFKVYYTQSDSASPTNKVVTLYKKQADGSFAFYATNGLQEETTGAYSTGKGLYYDWQLPAGVYRYYFRVSDGKRTAEWPGDSQSGTSLTMSLNTSHLANTVVVNSPAALSSPNVSPAFGNTGTKFTYTVTYTDADNDPPRYTNLYIGTHLEKVTGATHTGDNTTVTLSPVVAFPNPLYFNSIPYGDIALVSADEGVPAALRASTFRIVENTGTTFVVADAGKVLYDNLTDTGGALELTNPKIEIRRQVQMSKVGSSTNYAGGVQYQFDTSTDPTLSLGQGTRSYHFEFTDNWGTESDPEDGELSRFPTGANNEIQGPVVQDNRVPTLDTGKVTQTNDAVQPITGTSATQFTFSVNYTDPDNNPPSEIKLSIDPPLTQKTTATASSRTASTVTVNPSPSWTPGAYAGMAMRVTQTGSKAFNKRYTITGNTADTLTLALGTDLVTDQMGATDTFEVLYVAAADFDKGNVVALSPANLSNPDPLYTDGSIWVTNPAIRLPVGQHWYAFRCADGYKAAGDNPSNPGTAFTVHVDPTVNMNRVPRLRLDGVVADGVGTGDAPASVVGARTANSITVPGILPKLAQYAWGQPGVSSLARPYAIEIVRGTPKAGTEAVVETYEISGNEATDGAGDTVLYLRGNPTGVVQNGDSFRIALLPIDRVTGLANDTFTWRIAYWDADNDSCETGDPAMMRLIVDNNLTWSTTPGNIVRTRVDTNDLNYADGVVYQFTTNKLGSGAHTFYFEANDGANATRTAQVGVFSGPALNNPPVLSGDSITPLGGNPGTMYRFRVTYKDADNDAPDLDTDPTAPDNSWPRLILRNPGGSLVTDPNNKDKDGNPQQFFVMHPENSGTNYASGVDYIYDFQPSGGADPKNYSYEIVARSTGAGRTQEARTGVKSGPYVNQIPTLESASVAAASGGRTDVYTYSVTYKDADNHAPSGNQLDLTIKNPDGSTLLAAKMDPKAGQALDYKTAGVVYEYKTAPSLFTNAGQHSFSISASDQVTAPYVSQTVATPASGTGPTIDAVPVITLPTPSVTPDSGVPDTEFTFSARYQHPGKKAPNGGEKIGADFVGHLTLWIYKPSTGLLVPGGTPMTTADGVSDWADPGRLYTAKVKLTERGTYKYFVEVTSGTDTVYEPPLAAGDPDVAMSGPLVSGAPVISNWSVTPTRGGPGASYKFAATYTDPDGDSATSFTAEVCDHLGAHVATVNLVPANPANPTAENYKSGVVFEGTTTALNGPDIYRYYLRANDGASWVDYPLGVIHGNAASIVQNAVANPTVNRAPTLSDAAVDRTAGKTTDAFTFSVTYKDLDGNDPFGADKLGTPPSGWGTSTPGVYVELTDPDGIITLVELAGGVGSIDAGKSYSATPAATFTKLGNWKYRFRAWDGIDWVNLPSTGVDTYPTVRVTAANPPSLAAGGVSPNPGHANDTYDFVVTYTHPDNTAAQSVRLVVDGGAPRDMTRVVGAPNNDDYRDGEVYRLDDLGSLAEGNHNYYFVAGDGEYTVYFPAGAPGVPGTFNVNSAPRLSGATLSASRVDPSATNPGSSVKFSVTYSDADADPILLGAGNSYVHIQDAATDALVADLPLAPEAGSVYSATWSGAGLVKGQYEYYFVAKDDPSGRGLVAGDAAVAATGANPNPTQPILGPTVDTLAQLDQFNVTPDKGAPGATFTISARYRDLDGDEPTTAIPAFADGAANSLRLFVVKPDGALLDATGRNMAAADANAVTSGRRYTATVTLDATTGRGAYKYYIGVNDGLWWPLYLPDTADTTRAAQLPGPIVYSKPELLLGQVTPTAGKPNDAYTFTVKYRDDDNDGPDGAGVQLVLTKPGGAVQTIAMASVPPGASDWVNGVNFSTTQTLSDEGTYQYHFTVTDTGGDTQTTTDVSNPVVATNHAPTLDAWAVTPSKAAPGASFDYTVTYKDAEGDAPTVMRLYRLTSTGTALPPLDMVKVTALDDAYRNGVQYHVTTTALTTPDVYRYYFQAKDATLTSTYPAGVDPANLATTYSSAIAGPTVNRAPTLASASLSPLSGVATTNYIFQVTYRDADGIAPMGTGLAGAPTTPSIAQPGVYLELTTPSGTVNTYPMVTTDSNWAAGCVYRLQTGTMTPNPVSADGVYRWRFRAWDGVDSVDTPTTGTSAGPDVGGTRAPSLTNAQVTPNVGRKGAGTVADPGTEFVFSVTYTDPDNNAPEGNKVTLVLDGVSYDATARVGEDGNYANGEVFELKRQPLDYGTHTYKFSATDGTFVVETAEQSNVRVNYVPTLSNAAVSAARVDPTKPVSFLVTYKDLDNDQPQTISLHVVKGDLSEVTFPLTRDLTDTNAISSGVRYTTSVSNLGLGAYKYYFKAADALDVAVAEAGATPDPTAAIDGFVVNTLPTFPANSVTEKQGPPSDSTNPVAGDFTFSVTYKDADGHTPKTATLDGVTFAPKREAAPTGDALSLYLWKPGATAPEPAGIMAPIVGAAGPGVGREYRAKVALNGDAARGVYRWFVVFDDGLSVGAGPFGANTNRLSAFTDPTVWRVPVLLPGFGSDAVSPTRGKRGATYAWKVSYTDADSQGPDVPGKVRLFVQDSAGNTALKDKATDLPVASVLMENISSDWAQPQDFTYDQVLANADLAGYKYRFEVTDTGGDTAYWPGPTAADFKGGLIVDDNVPPALLNVTVAPAKGAPGTGFDISAIYQDDNGDAPVGNSLLVTILDHNSAPAPGSPIALIPAPGAGTAYKSGVQFTGRWTSTGAAPDVYTFAVTARDAGLKTVWPVTPTDFAAETSWDAASAADPNCRITVNRAPALSTPRVTPGTGVKNTNYVYSVTYTDPDGNNPVYDGVKAFWGDVPQAVRDIGKDRPGVYLVVSGPSGTFSRQMQTPVGADFTGPVTYTFESGLDDQVPSMSTLDPGPYTFRFVAWDGMDTAAAPVTGTVSGPVVSDGSAPELTDASVLTTPGNQPSGYRSDTFVFKVRYRDVDNTAPTLLKLYIDEDPDPSLDDAAANPVRHPKTLAAGEITRLDAKSFAEGTYYAYTAPAGSLPVGTHTFRWVAKDNLTTVALPQTTLPRLNGPTVNNRAPVLSQARDTSNQLIPLLSPTSGPSTREYVYTVRYTDADNDGPTNGAVSLILDGQTVQMVAKDAADQDYTNGADFEYRKVGLSVDNQPHTYQFGAADGYDSVTWPTVAPQGPAINTPPELSNPAYTPAKPTAADQVTFSIVYKDVDGDLPSAINVHVHQAGGARVGSYTLVASGGTPTRAQIQAGVTYQVSVPGLQLGAYEHYYTASDPWETTTKGGEDLTPASEKIPGPTVNTPPTLTEPKVTPGSAAPDSTFTFSAKYTDPDGQPPLAAGINAGDPAVADRLFLQIVDPKDGPMTPVHMSPADGASYKQGRLYSAAVVLKNRGLYSFTVTAADQNPLDLTKGMETVTLTAPSDTGPRVWSVPVLTDKGVNPMDGVQDATRPFTWTVLYQDADKHQPDANGVRIYITDPEGNTANFPMQAAAGTPDYVAGVEYSYSQVLSIEGTYHYYYEVTDESDTGAKTEYDREPDAPDTHSGPNVHNTPPKFLAVGVNPSTGTPVTTFTWTAIYEDDDNHAPEATYPRVVIMDLDGNPVKNTNGDAFFTMKEANAADTVYTQTTANPSDTAGKTYVLTKQLPVTGSYRFYFVASDGMATPRVEVVEPAGADTDYSKALVGPTVGTDAPMLTWPQVMVGGTCTTAGTGVTRTTGPLFTTLTAGGAIGIGATDYTIASIGDGDHLTLVQAAPAATGAVWRTMVGGACDTSGNRVTRRSGPLFTTLSAGGGLAISGLNYTIQTVVDADHVDLVETPPVVNGAIWNVMNQGANGGVNDRFTYSVKYSHGGNLAPETIQVVIDGVASAMVKKNPAAADFRVPVEYLFSTQLESARPDMPHNYYFTAAAGGKGVRLPESGTLSGPGVGNSTPTLTLGGVNPVQGNTTTNFVYSVTYKDADNQAPQSVQLVQIEPDADNPGSTVEIPCTMTRTGSGTPDYAAGVVYQYTARLSGGVPHRYYFQANDGFTSARFPSGSFVIDGPSVPNTAPLISAGTVTPSSGGSNTLFTFTCIYTDTSTDLAAQGDAPSQIRVFIDNDPAGKGMSRDNRTSVLATLRDGDYRNGEAYIYQTNSLAVGPHTFSFLATDDRDVDPSDGVRPNDWQQETVRLPQSGAMSGPTVSNNNLPTLTGGTVTFPAGTTPTTATFFTYSVVYTDADNNPPARIQVFISEDSGATWAAQDLNKKDSTDNVFTDGVTYELTQRFPPGKPTVTAPGQPTTYRYYFEAVDSVELSVVKDPASGRSGPYVGPTVYDNTAPTVTPAGSFTLIRAEKSALNPAGTQVQKQYRGLSPQPVGVPQYIPDYWGGRGPGTTDAGTVPAELLVKDPMYRYSRFQELTFRAIYKDPDNQPPSEMLCVINGNPTPMEKENPSDNNYVTGVTYVAKIKMNSNFPSRPNNTNYASPLRGNFGYDTWYTYAFQCNDSNDPASRAIVQDPDWRLYVNTPPQLEGASGGGTGPSDTVWTFSVQYVDDNFPNNPFYNTNSGDRPVYVRVVIDGVAHDMEAAVAGDTDYNSTGFRHPDGSMKPGWVTQPTWPANNGCQFVYSQKLAIGTHTYYFETTDGWDVAKTAEVNGPSVTNSAPVISTPPAGGLSPATGTQATDFTYTAIYKDVDNQPPSVMEVVIDGVAHSMEKDPTESNYTTGVTYRYTTKMGPGSHRYRFQASDSNNPALSDRFPATQDSTGPIINYPPALANGTVSPATGNEGTLYSYTVDYSDGDGQQPSFIKVFVDGTGFDMTKVDPTQNDFTKPITYRYQTTLKAVPPPATHSFKFKTGDGQEETETTILSGPSVNADNHAPTLDASAVAPQRGVPGTTFTFTTTYTDQDNDAPVYVRAKVFPSGAAITDTPIATLNMTKVDASNTAYRAGVVYSATLNNLQGPDIYQFCVEASDADKTFQTPLISGPTVNQLPTLANGQVSPSVGGLTTTYVFTVTYTDPDNTDPAMAKKHDPVPPELDDATIPAADGSVPGSDKMPGVFLVLTTPGKQKTITRMSAASNTFAAGATFQLPLNLKVLGAGTYTFQFVAWDGIDSTAFPPAGVLTGPQVNDTNPPTLTNATVTPDPGFKNDSYVYTVTYTDLDNKLPDGMKLWIDANPAVDPPITMDKMSRLDTNPASKGTVYSYTVPAGTLGLGTHTYVWATTDDNWATSTQLPANATARVTGPVVQNHAPTLTGGTVTPAAGRTSTEFVYSVVYTDLDDDAPSATSGVQLILDGVPQAQPMTKRADESGKKYSAGVTYEFRISGLAARKATEAPHNYQFSVSDNTDSVTTVVTDGPIVNSPPELTALNPLAPQDTVDPKAANPLAAVDFHIVYRDEEGQLPSTIRVFVHKRTPDSPDTPVGGYSLSPWNGRTPSAPEIQAGVHYWVRVTGLQTGAYSHYFVASDTLDQFVYPAGADKDATKRIMAPTMNNKPILALDEGKAPVTPDGGDVSSSFKFQVVYSQEKGVAAKYVRLHVDDRSVEYDMTTVGGNPVDGVLYEVSLPGTELTTTPKPHAFYFHASDGVQECFLGKGGLDYDTLPSTAVPYQVSVNDKPLLAGVTLTALNEANPAASTKVYPKQTPPTYALSTQRIKYEVVYRDANGDAPKPNQVSLYRDGGATAVAMTSTNPSATADDYKAGVVYSYTTSAPLSPGSHSFVMAVNDGSDTTYAHSGTALTGTTPPAVDMAQGNTAAPPVMTLNNARVSPNGGGVGSDFEFAVNYVSFLTKTSGHLAGCTAKALVTKYASSGSDSGGVQMPDVPLTSQVDASGNVTFKGKCKLADLGDYRFQISVNDGQFEYLTNPINQPKVSKPQLSSLKVDPVSGVVGRSFLFSAKYHHEGWQPANRVILHVRKNDVEINPPGTPEGQNPGWPMSTSDFDTALLPTTAKGWTYTAAVPLGEPGSYGFFVEAWDGDAASNPGYDIKPEGGTPQTGPTVTAPGLTPADSPVTPATGGCAGGVFTFAVKYTYGSNIPPKYVRLYLTKVGGAAATAYDLVAESGGDYATGKLFSKSIPLTEDGDYTFHFGVMPEGATAETTTLPLNGLKLTVERPELPSLSGAKVEQAKTGGNRYTYSVVYKQSQNLAPAWVRLFIDYDEAKGTAARTVDMTAEAAATTYSSGVTYTYTTPEPLPAGRHTYLIKATHGIKVEGKTPEYSLQGTGPFINQEPTLEAPRVAGESQTVTPLRGDENTTYTFSIIYKDPDGEQAASVKVSVGNKSYTMTQVDASKTSPADYIAGVLYQVKVAPTAGEVSLPAGDLSHSFQANDGHTTVRMPASGVLIGPKVLARTELTLTASRGSVPLDGVTTVSVSGGLTPAVSGAVVKIVYSVAVLQADGSTRSEARITRELTADGDGLFSTSGRPDQDGTWTVRAEYAGDVAVGGTRGSGVKEITFAVSPAQNNYPASLYMVGLPVTPSSTDLTKTFQGAGFDSAVYAGKTGTTSNWLKYSEGNFPAARPGMGFWLFTRGSVNAVASGRIVDHDAEFAIPVRAGWQQIANPYLQATQWSKAQFSSGGSRMSLADARTARLIYDHAWAYDGVRSEMRLVHATAEGADRFLQPWQGAWFYSRVAGELILAKPSDSSVTGLSDRAERSRNRANDGQWSIALRASNGKQSSGSNYAGVSSDTRSADLAYLEKPPVMPGYVDLYFEGLGDGRHYATDYRPAVAGEQVWNFVVATDVTDRAITVSAPDLSRVPKTLDVFLEDVDAGGKRVYLRTTGGYTFNPGEGGERHMKLIVRPRSEGSLRVVDVTFTKTRGARSIGVVLSQDAVVTVEILSPSGQRLAVVADSQATVDRRAQFVWDETRADGARLPSGIYLAQVTAKEPDGQACRSIRAVVMTR